MKSFFIGLIVSLVGMQLVAQEREYVIVVHGGAGAMAGLENDQEKAAQYYAALDSALTIGDAILSKGGEGPQAVMAVINYFESNPLFNAGVGATCTIDGAFELDAAIMEGKDLSAGAVAGVKFIKHPIDAAYAVKTQTEHVMLAGEGADIFAKEKGLETVEDNLYFATPKTMKWVEQLKKESLARILGAERATAPMPNLALWQADNATASAAQAPAQINFFHVGKEAGVQSAGFQEVFSANEQAGSGGPK